MNFTQAVQTAAQQAALTTYQRAALVHAAHNANAHPLLWAAAEGITVHRYQRQTGKTIGGPGFDWSTVLQWLIDNLPTIISLLLMIFGV